MAHHSQRVRAMPRSGIREIMDLTAGRTDVIHLEVGQPDFRTPDHVVEAAVRAARDGAHGYTPNKGILPLREAAVERLRLDHGVEASAEGVVVTCGAVNALYEVLHVLLDPGDAILVPDPGWPNFAMMADLNGARALRYPLDPSRGYRPDLGRVDELAASSGARVLLLNSPNNPTGSVLPEADVRALVAIAEQHDLFIVSDECYGRIVFDGTEHVSPARLAPERVALVTSVSKSYAMTGWRIGFLVVPDELANAAAKVQEAVVACATTVSQHAALAALTGDQSAVHEMTAAYQRRRDVATVILGEAGHLLGEPRGAFYVMADVGGAGPDGASVARRLVEERALAVAPGPTFGPGARTTVRLSLAASEDHVREGVTRLVDALQEWSTT